MQSCSTNSFLPINLTSSKDENLLPLRCSTTCSILACSVDSELNHAPNVLFSALPQEQQPLEFLLMPSLYDNDAKDNTTNTNSSNSNCSDSDSNCNNNSWGDVLSVAEINGGTRKKLLGDGAEDILGASEHSTMTNSSQSSSAVNARRFMNPAFSFSPSVANSSETIGISSLNQLVTIHTDKRSPPDRHIYVLGTTEGRRNFFADCHYLAKNMSASMIVNELITAMLIASNYSDSLCSIASLLPKVIVCIQGLDDSVFVYFMGLIMKLCCAADHAVVRQISSSLAELFLHVTNDIAEHLLLPLLMSMQVSFWSSPRAVAAALLGIFASKENIVQKSGLSIRQWFDCFSALARDKSDFVREIAVSSLHQWVVVARIYQVDLTVMPLRLFYELLESTEGNAIRYLCVTEFVSLAEHMGKEATTKYLQMAFITLCKDSVWRVRYIAAKHFGKFVTFCLCADKFLDVFMTLCDDENKEIRAAAVEQLAVFCSNLISQNALCKICAAATSLAKDKESVVRMAVASLIYLFFSPSVIEVCTAEQLQIVIGLLTDEDYVVMRCAMRNLEKVALNMSKNGRFMTSFDFNTNTKIGSITSVRLRVMGRRKSINNSITTNAKSDDGGGGSDDNVSISTSSVMVDTGMSILSLQQEQDEQSQHSLCEGRKEKKRGKGRSHKELLVKWRVCEKQRRLFMSVLDCIIDNLRVVSQSNNWRIRETAVVVIRHLSLVVAANRFAPLTQIVRLLLWDNVSAVRRGAVQTLCTVAFRYGPEWAAFVTFDLLQKEFALIAEQSYIWRAIAIKCLSATLFVVCKLSPLDLRRQELLQQWVRLVVDFSKDEVSNVRLALARSMVEWWELYVECGVQHDVLVRQCVERLQHDEDVDISRLTAGLVLPCRPAEG